MAKVQSWVGFLLALLFPLFFLTTTQEFYTTNKLYFLGFSVLVLLTLSALNLFSRKKLSWRRSPFDIPILIFLILYATSVMIVSPNKIQALLNPVTGFAVMFFLGLMYYVLHQENNRESTEGYNHLALMDIAAGIVGILTIIFFFNPLAKVNLPSNLLFLKNSSFTPLGTPIDLLLFLGFFVLYGGLRLYHARNSSKKSGPAGTLLFIAVALAFFLTLYNVIRPVPQQIPSADGKKVSIFNTLPPYSISWYAAVETLKSPKTALFGVGPDNFAAVYTRVKPASYNATNLWNVNYTQSRSFLLELWATTGVLGLGSFILLLLVLLRAVKNTEARSNTFYLIAALALFPASLIMLFLLFLLLSFSTRHEKGEERSINLANNTPAYAGIALLSLLVIGGISYLFGRSYVAEYSFKNSLDAFPSNKVEPVYNNMRRAIIINPYIERFRVSFSQLNMLIANNIAASAQQQAKPADGEEGTEQPQISEQDRQTIAQGIQAAIAEAKAAVALNPNKASNWENLAVIYRNIINVAEGADEWTVASYQRSILIDPNNPIYHLNLGGVFYQLQAYDQAISLFGQAANLKPDWPNAFYNLAWAHYQKQDFERAALAMQQVLTLLPDKKSEDYKRAQKEFDEFKQKVPSQSTATPSGELNLPTPPAASIEPKLQLPRDAEPPTGGPTPRTTTPSVTGPSPTPEE